MKNGWENWISANQGLPGCEYQGTTQCQDIYNLDGADTTFYIVSENGLVYKSAMISITNLPESVSGITVCPNPAKEKIAITGGAFKDTTGIDYVPEGKTLKLNTEDNYYYLEDEFTVTFDADNAEGDTDVTSVKVTAGDKVSKPEDPVKEGYNFDGWYNGETAFDFDAAISSNVDLKAKWTAVALTLSSSTRKGVEGNSGSALTVKIDGTKATDEQKAKVVWTSSDESVVTVAADGKMTYVAPGTATVTAKYIDSEATCAVTVEEALVEHTSPNGTVTYKSNLDYTNVSSNGTYKLLGDVTTKSRIAPTVLARDVTIDLNGHTITSEATDYVFYNNRNGSENSQQGWQDLEQYCKNGNPGTGQIPRCDNRRRRHNRGLCCHAQ